MWPVKGTCASSFRGATYSDDTVAALDVARVALIDRHRHRWRSGSDCNRHRRGRGGRKGKETGEEKAQYEAARKHSEVAEEGGLGVVVREECGCESTLTSYL